jgi:hypothetical protein
MVKTYIYISNPPKFTQIGISGLKINHLATLIPSYVPTDSISAEAAETVIQ